MRADAKDIWKDLARQIQTVYEQREAESIAMLLVEHYSAASRTEIMLNAPVEISAKELQHAVQRLKNGDPIQYILGHAHFYGYDFRVSPAVLIPRPETEELTDLIIREYNSGRMHVLDIGTGSGCIAVTLKLNLPEIQVTAMDVSPEALAIARQNAEIHGVPIEFILADLFKTEKLDQVFDVIVSNPPYVTMAEKELMEPRVYKREPQKALFVENEDPLKFYQGILQFAHSNLVQGGKLYLEINESFGNAIKGLFSDYGYRNIRILKDMQQKDRIATGVRT